MMPREDACMTVRKEKKETRFNAITEYRILRLLIHSYT